MRPKARYKVLKKKAKREKGNHSGRLSLLSTEHCPFWACAFLLAFAPFSLHLKICILAPSILAPSVHMQ